MKSIQAAETVVDEQLQLHLGPWPTVGSSVVVNFWKTGSNFFLDHDRNNIVAKALLSGRQEEAIEQVVKVFMPLAADNMVDVVFIEDIFEWWLFETLEGCHCKWSVHIVEPASEESSLGIWRIPY